MKINLSYFFFHLSFDEICVYQIVQEEAAAEGEAEAEADNITRIFFDPGHYSVMENCGSFMVTVTREG